METSATLEVAEPGLRERRRLQTEREIALAALGLFEAQGVDGTTVEDIARAAGISPRTFFRYFHSKELAAFVPEVDIDLRFQSRLEQMDAAQPLAPQLVGMFREVLEGLVEDDAAAVVRRVRRLELAEPAVRLAGMRRDEEHTDAFVARLAEVFGAGSDLEVKVVVEGCRAALRITLDRWASGLDRGAEVDVCATFDVCLDALSALGRRA
ncbi:TetR family transcriptional regulator [Nocardioides sp. GY 10127]|uniref:TetR family transcriptional regulator n=1 Tax=Nocardioides sp. GY 10127 TaxID=2569762 RepID=UPI001981CEEC|nr:TetR family transcriptional regulator [Nocardioides sp. GY 10127]